MTDIDRIRERHSPVFAIAVSGERMCVTCMTYWPCETRIVLDALDEIAHDRDMRESRRIDAEYELVIALGRWKADADRLAEALRMLLRNPNAMSVAREALRQHDNQDRGGCDCHLWSSTHTCPVHGHVAAMTGGIQTDD